MHLKKIVQGFKKWHWNFSRPSGVKVTDQNSQNVVFGSVIQEPLGLPQFDAIFEFLGQFATRYIYYFSKRYW